MIRVYCGKSGGKNCASCANYTGHGSGAIVCKSYSLQCRREFSLANWWLAITGRNPWL